MKEKRTLSPDKGANTYLLRMVQNGCLDYLRHKAVENSFVQKTFLELQIEELEWSRSRETIQQRKEQLKAIYSAIDKLPSKCKEIFIKAYLEQQKHTEIAEHFQISIRTVEAQVYKALKFIRNSLLCALLCTIAFS